MLSSRHTVFVVVLLLACVCWSQSQTSGTAAQVPPAATTTSPVGTSLADDPAQEPVIFERMDNRLTFESDGSGTQETIVVAHVQSQAGLQALAVLTFSYTSYNQTVDVDYVRVKKADGSVVITPDYNIQDMPGDVTRRAPMYSDLHEKHVTVKALAVGDVLEYKVRYRIVKPQVPGQFWFQHDFMKLFITREEDLVISVPRDKYVKVESSDVQPQVSEENSRKIYTWKTANPAVPDREKLLNRREVPKPAVQLTTFRNWGEVGNWYEELQRPQLAITPQLQAKATELTKGLTSDDDKIRAIYNFVSLHFHYVSLSFGVGRYQPHSAEDVLENEYGDCKDKHTLLAALLKAAGYDAWPALINANRKIDPTVPSPGQFDHVITVVPVGGRIIWLDTTPEVAPFALLMANLRDKEALVIPTNKAASLDQVGSLTKTPSEPPFPIFQSISVEGKLDPKGTFTARVTFTQRGDTEVLNRLAFRSVSPSQWKDLAQGISYRSGFSGEVSNPTASVPDETTKPFSLSYDYTKKSFGDWENHRVVAPVPWFGIESAGSDDKKPNEPILLGALGELVYTSTTILPAGYAPKYSENVDLTEDFADYHAVYSIETGVLIANRKLVIKKREVPLESWDTYKKFCKALADERDRYINLETSATEYPEGEGPEKSSATGATFYSYETPSALVRHAKPANPEADVAPSSGRTGNEQLMKEAWQANPEAGRLMVEAAQAFQQRDYTRAEETVQRILVLDPKFFGAHASLASIALTRNQPDAAVAEMRTEIEYHPENSAAYEFLSGIQMRMGRNDDAIATLRKWIAIDPGNNEAALQLSRMLIANKNYAEAIQVLEGAMKSSPDSTNLQYELARAYLYNHQNEQGLVLLKQSAPSKAGALNDAAFLLADLNIDLGLAKQYSDTAMAALTASCLKAEIDDEGFTATAGLPYVWDTVGWVYFRDGKYNDALPYLRSAWTLSQSPTEGYHLGQLYEKLGKTQEAIHTYKLALASPGRDHENIRKRYEGLTNTKGDSDVPTLRRGPAGALPSPGEELSRMRTFKLPPSAHGSGSAIYTVVFSPGRVDSVRYRSGDESLKSLTDQIAALKFKTEFPDSTPSRVFRRGMLVCSKISGCDFVLLLPDSVHSVDSPATSN